MTLKLLLPYIAPPLLGALIGYITNYIAIRMLFRPLRPWRLLGVRVPLTPGIIPAKRGELAARMGQTVGGHLLTAEDVGRALETPGFRRELRGALHDKLAGFLDRDLGPAVSLVPAAYRSRFTELSELLQRKLVDEVFAWLESEECETLLRRLLEDKEAQLLSRDLDSCLTPERFTALRGHLDARFGSALHAPALQQLVERLVERGLDRLLADERPLRELLPADLIALLHEQIGRELPPLLEKFGGLLYDPEFRRQLTVKARAAIENFLDSLGGLSGLLAGFFDMDKVYQRIPEFLDQAGDEISRWLRRAETQQQLADLLRERFDAWLDKPLKSYVDKLSYEKVAGMRGYLRGKAVALLHDRRTAEKLLSLTEQGLDKLKDRPFSELIDRIAPADGRPRARQWLGDRLLATLRSPAARAGFAAIVAARCDDWLLRKPLGRLSARLPADLHGELEEALYAQLGDLLRREVPPLIDTLNISRMVEAKLNQLDLLQVEDIILGIMKEQFKYINLFGGLLGLLIGLLNLLVLRLV